MLYEEERRRYTMEHPIFFGSAYYPEYMPYERTEKDIEMMKAAGMNVVRIAESTWATLEPEEGVFDFSYIDRVIEKTKEAEMMVIIGTPTYAVPSWLVNRDPDIMVERKTGRTKYGYRQMINLLNPTYIKYSERVIRKILEHTVHEENVIGYQIDNETKHSDNFGSEIQKEFILYLKKKFITTENLNQAFGLNYWSNAIHNWEDFPDMKGCINGGLAAEFEKYQRKIASDFLAWQSDIVNQYKRKDQFITQNMGLSWKKFGADIAHDGYSYGIQRGICHNDAAKHLTMSAVDIYHPTQDKLTGAEIAFGGDMTRSLKQDNYLVMECQAQAFKYWTPYPGQMKLHAYSHLASGANGILYWNWHSIHSGYETYWKGILSHDLGSNPTYKEIISIGQEWKKISSHLKNLKKENKTALVVDNHTLAAFEWFPIDRDLTYNDVVRWMYDNLYKMNIECDIVYVDSLNPEEYKVIITPALYSISEEILKKLENFVRKGGVLISSFKSFVSDEFLRVYPDTQPHFLQSCFGMYCNQYTEPEKMKINGENIKYIAELLIPDGADVLYKYEHRYWNQYAGITGHSYGDGYAYYIGCYTDDSVLQELYRTAFEAAGIKLSETVWPTIIRSGINGNGSCVHYILHYSENPMFLTCPYENVVDILTGENWKKGEQIPLDEWGVKILEEK